MVSAWKMSDLNDAKQSFVLLCAEMALNKWLMYLLAEENKLGWFSNRTGMSDNDWRSRGITWILF